MSVAQVLEQQAASGAAGACEGCGLPDQEILGYKKAPLYRRGFEVKSYYTVMYACLGWNVISGIEYLSLPELTKGVR
jgi:hypothetical protein